MSKLHAHSKYSNHIDSKWLLSEQHTEIQKPNWVLGEYSVQCGQRQGLSGAVGTQNYGTIQDRETQTRS